MWIFFYRGMDVIPCRQQCKLLYSKLLSMKNSGIGTGVVWIRVVLFSLTCNVAREVVGRNIMKLKRTSVIKIVCVWGEGPHIIVICTI